MKAVVDACHRASSMPGIRTSSNNNNTSRCMASKSPKSDGIDTTEMSACFSKLMELVPSIPKDHKITKTQLLQHVIDYILDLELALDTNPAVPALKSCGLESMDCAFSSIRQPLSERSDSNNINTLTTESEFLQQTSEDLELRPPSK